MSIDIKKLKALAEAATGFSDVSLAPDVLLELIDQNERLTKNYKSLCDSVAHLNAATTSAGDEVARLRAENESANSRLHEVAVACATAEQERDQLRAEIAGLRTGYEAYERVNAELKAEVEALRKLGPSKEIIWCACGDGYPVNSYGAGFMAANGDVCENCNAAEPELVKITCSLEFFENLRDSAAAEAEEHRQCMGSYRPHRQELLDAVVRQCDELIAGVSKEPSNG